MTLDLSRIHGLCFDVDGTLSDTDDRWVARLERGLAPFRPVLFGHEPRTLARRVVMGIEAPGNFLLGVPDRLGFDRPLADTLRSMERVGLLRSPRRDGFWLIPQVRETLAVPEDPLPDGRGHGPWRARHTGLSGPV